MSASPNPRDELLRLLSAVEDDLLEPGDAARLGELLRNDAEARKRYYDYVILASLLRREGRRAAASQETDSNATPSPLESRREISIPREPSHRRAWLAAMAVSALLALLLSVSEVTGVTRLVPTIVRIVTGEGSLVIEVDDPTVSVTLDGEDITIHGAGIHELRLRPGTHRFVATKNGRPARTELVTVQKGERTVVAVSFEPREAPRGGDASPVLLGHTGPVYSVAFTRDGKRVVSASMDGTARVWDTASGSEIASFAGHNACVYCAVVLPDGKRVLSGSSGLDVNVPADWSVCLWELETGRELNRWEGDGDGITTLAVSASGGQALIGAYSGQVTVWNIDDWREIKSIQAAPLLWSVGYSPDEQRVVTSSGIVATQNADPKGPLRIWDLASGSELAACAGHVQGGWQAVYSPSGESVASTGSDWRVRLWDARTAEQLREIDLGNVTTGVAWSADGRRLLVGHYGVGQNVRLWDVETMQEVGAFAGHTTGVQSVALSRDGRWAASGSHDCTVRLWRLPVEASDAPSE
jgi:WD40 repeat protein